MTAETATTLNTPIKGNRLRPNTTPAALRWQPTSVPGCHVCALGQHSHCPAEDYQPSSTRCRWAEAQVSQYVDLTFEHNGHLCPGDAPAVLELAKLETEASMIRMLSGFVGFKWSRKTKQASMPEAYRQMLHYINPQISKLREALMLTPQSKAKLMQSQRKATYMDTIIVDATEVKGDTDAD